MTTINDLVPFSTGIARLGIPRDSAEKYLRRQPRCLPPVHRIGYQRFFDQADVERYAAVRQAVSRDLEQFAEERRWIARSRE